MDPEKAVLTSAMVTLGSTVAASMLPETLGGKGEIPKPRLLFGTAIAFTGLSIFAEIQPSIAVPLSAAIAITALTYYGIPLLDNYFNPNSKGNKS